MLNNSEQPLIKHKIVFLGDNYVGKTSIIDKFVHGCISKTYQPTIGIDFISKNIFIEEFTVRVQLWDLAQGSKRFRCLIPSYIKDSSAAILCYDVENFQSFQNLFYWLDPLKEKIDNPIFLIANKIDVKQNRVVTQDQGVQFAKHNNLLYYECSAKDGTNIEMIFYEIAKFLLNPKRNNKVETQFIDQQAKLQVQSNNLELISKFNLGLLGDETVGKTSIRSRFFSNVLIKTYDPTLNQDVESKSVIIDGNKVQFIIWEICGYNKFMNWASSFEKGLNAIIICYDVTNINTFQSVPQWIECIRKNDHTSKIYALLANKVDAKQGRVVSQDVGIQFARDNNMQYYEKFNI